MNNEVLSSFAQQETKRYKVKVGVFLFLIQNDHILLLRRFNTGIADGLYVVPMGGLKQGETASQGIIREAKEEADIILKPHDIQACHIMHRLHHMPEGNSFEQMDVFFRATSYEGVIKNAEPHKCDELKFYPINNLPRNTERFICHALECMFKGHFFSEFGWKENLVVEAVG